MGDHFLFQQGTMISKSCILLLGVAIAFAASAFASEEKQLSENFAFAAARVVRSADPGKRKAMKKKGKKTMKKKGRKNRKNKAMKKKGKKAMKKQGRKAMKKK